MSQFSVRDSATSGKKSKRGNHAAKEAIEQYKDLNMADMERILRDMPFGKAETNVILAALVLAGAKFTVE